MNNLNTIPGSETLPPLFALMRPRQWTKNLACLGGVFFSGNMGNADKLGTAALVTAAFCMLSSFTYILNDFVDLEGDRQHAVKRERPLAKGVASVNGAVLLALGLAVGTAVSLLFAPPAAALAAGAYFVLNVGYSLGGKRVVILDLMMIAVGFVLRILAGTEACGVVASDWILACGFSLALFIGCAKRRSELSAPAQGTTREVLKNYSIGLLDRMCMVTLTLTLCSYLLFVVLAHEGKGPVVTFLPVVFGTLRYLYLVDQEGCGEAPELILWHDRPIQLTILAWIGLYALVLYGNLGR